MTTPPNPLPSTSPETPGAPPAAPKSHVLAWILGGCGTVLVLFIIVAVLGVRMFVKKNVRVGPNGEVTVQMPGGGSLRTGKAKDIGIPVYPVTTGDGTGMEVTSPRENQSMSMATYFSKNPVEKVDAWYGENLGKEYVREGIGQKHSIPSGRRFPVPIQSNSITYVLKSGDAVSVVALTQLGTGAQIVLMRTGGPAAQ